ncbi:HAD family hydrolase [Kutzneria kofuensis]|uniref:HAD superfamily hydrolase (TIGR01549 family) n=1 Tax=Kutzneria kofuensis TaxID=103725 RepID=A0A7W9KTB5_9PSEU|nr:HAD family hydrolase [Kutzneria kofuensis]MBB5897574.1 HAD superfamily hydrolase (TIGR01549 family) [Kutzneria kofuensis]
MLALFDLDGTLADRRAGQHAWSVEFCADHGFDPAEVDWLMAADGNGMVTKEEYFGRVRERYGLARSVDDLWRQYRDRQPTLVPAYEGMLDGLERLRAAGWRIGVVTNGYEDVQTLTLTSSGIAEHVDGWAISAAENVRKPDVRLFEIAAARAGAPLGDGWMVGDNAGADIGGGRAAGLRTAWVHHDRSWPAELDVPDHIVAGAVEVVPLILR